MKHVLLATLFASVASMVSAESFNLSRVAGTCTDAEEFSDYVYYDTTIESIGFIVVAESDDGVITEDYFRQGKKVFVAKFDEESWAVCVDQVAPGTILEGLRTF